MKNFVRLILRYKILHIIFWSVNAVMLFHEFVVDQPDQSHLLKNYVDTIDVSIFQMLCVYTCIYLLVPRLFAKEKYFQFLVSVIGTILFFMLINVAVQLFYVEYYFGMRPPSSIFIPYIGDVIDCSIITIPFILIILIEFYYNKEQKNKLIEQDRLETEINSLKAQMNPHFLFNALNSIYVLMDEDKKLASETLLKFSSLLRYQLYDCSAKTTSIENEISFIKNYINLEMIRNGKNISVVFNEPEKTIYDEIAPFILMTFVENAFKHISHFNDKKNIAKIEVVIKNGILYFTVENTCDPGLTVKEDRRKGIGLRNVRRRLELLYPESHELIIAKEGDLFTVNLILHLHGN